MFHLLLDYFHLLCFSFHKRHKINLLQLLPLFLPFVFYENALNNVVPQLKKLLINTFGLHNLKELVLVCIPASSQQKTSLRYKEFSQMLCSEAGMTSAYDKMTVISERIAKHLGGVSIR